MISVSPPIPRTACRACFVIGLLLLTAACKTSQIVQERKQVILPDQSVSNDLLASIEAVRVAMQLWDFQTMTSAADELANLVVDESREEYWRKKWLGTAWFHSLLIVGEDSPEENNSAQRMVIGERAILTLNQALELQPEDSDCHIMLTILHGLAIQSSPLSAFARGPKFLKHKNAARKYGSANPRVNYLEGVSMLNQAHSDAELAEALTRLIQAEKQFAKETMVEKRPWEPAWGWDKNRYFIAEIQEKLGEIEKASDGYRNIMQDAPWIKRAQEGYERCRKQLAKR